MLTIYLIKNTVKQLYYKVIIQFKTTIFYFKIKNNNLFMWWFIIITNVENSCAAQYVWGNRDTHVLFLESLNLSIVYLIVI